MGKRMIKYGLILGGFCACMLIAFEIHSFVYDVEPNTHIFQEYLSEMSERQELPITLQEWMDKNDHKTEAFWDWLGDQCDSCFNPWYEPAD